MYQRSHYSDKTLSFNHQLDIKPDQRDFYMHTHDRCELYCFLSGKGIFRIEGTVYPLKRYDILLMRRAEAHCLEIDSSAAYERIAIHFSEDIIRPIDPDLTLLSAFNNRELGKRNILHRQDFENENYIIHLENMISSDYNSRIGLLTNLFSLLNEINKTFLLEKTSQSDETASLTANIIGYINDNLSENLSLDEISAHFFISKPQLCRIFKKSTGSSVWDYITVKRLMRAKDLIRSGLPATAAASSCGFGDYSAFYRAFHKKFGHAPKSSRDC